MEEKKDMIILAQGMEPEEIATGMACCRTGQAAVSPDEV